MISERLLRDLASLIDRGIRLVGAHLQDRASPIPPSWLPLGALPLRRTVSFPEWVNVEPPRKVGGLIAGGGGVFGETQRSEARSAIREPRLCSRGVNWEDFERSAPELAAFGRDRLEGRVAFLATVRADGSPRVHPVEAWFAAGRMFVRMWPTSAKVRALEHDPRLRDALPDGQPRGRGGEFFVAGRGARVDDPTLIAAASAGKHDPEQYVLFEFGVEEAIGTTYEGDEPTRRGWRAS